MSALERIFIALLCLTSLGAAQGVEVQASRQGLEHYQVSIRATQEPALDCVTAIASACGFALDLRSTQIGSILARERLSIELVQEPLGEAIRLIAMAGGLVGDVDLDAMRIVIDALEDDEDDEDLAGATEIRRQRAIQALLSAFGDSADPEDEVQLMLRTARLQLDGGEFSLAFDTYDGFLREYPKHPSVPEATVAAAHAALMAERHTEVQRIVQEFFGDFPDDVLVGRAQLIAARSRLATGNIGGGVALLSNLIRKARDREIPQRDGILAELLLAEARHGRGEDEDAINGLEEAEIRYDRRQDEDLIRQIRLYLAICRRALGKSRDALDDLELAAFEIPEPELRVRTMLLHSELMLEAGDPFLALTSARVALRLEPTGRRRFEVMRMMGRALRGMQLESDAGAELLAAVLEAPRLLPDPETRRREVSKTLREIGAIYLDQGKLSDAITSFQSVIDAAERHGADDGEGGRELVAECRFLIASSQYQANEWKAAIRTLNSITEGVTSESLLSDIRRLKGDCYLASGMPEAAMRVWREGDHR